MKQYLPLGTARPDPQMFKGLVVSVIRLYASRKESKMADSDGSAHARKRAATPPIGRHFLRLGVS